MLITVAAWTLWARGVPETTAATTTQSFVQGEKGAAIMALVAGGYSLVAAVFLSANHNNNLHAAKIFVSVRVSFLQQTSLRVLSSLASAILAGGVIAFAAISLPKLNDLPVCRLLPEEVAEVLHLCCPQIDPRRADYSGGSPAGGLSTRRRLRSARRPLRDHRFPCRSQTVSGLYKLRDARQREAKVRQKQASYDNPIMQF